VLENKLIINTIKINNPRFKILGLFFFKYFSLWKKSKFDNELYLTLFYEFKIFTLNYINER